jgi:hypothetical protein
MGLEAPLALLGLLFAALPWLAHRIRRRDLTPVPLPTFALLISAEAKKRRSRGITDLILLALRIGLVALAIMALAAPFVSARLQFGDGSVASVAIVIDDSMSMLRTRGTSSSLMRAQQLARDAVASLPRGSEVCVILAGAPPRVLQPRTSDLGLAALAIDGLPEGAARGDGLAAAIAMAGAQLGGAVHQRRRVLVISDFAAHTQLSEEMLRVSNAEVSLRRTDDAEDPLNLYVASARAVPDPLAANVTSVAIEIGASGSRRALEQLGTVRVRVRAQDKELGRADITLTERRGRATLRVPTPELSADPTASVIIEQDDALALDNSAGLLLRKTDALHVMLVNGDPHPASREDELFYALPALRLAPPEVATFSLRSIDAGALAKHDLTQTDVIVLANVAPPSAEWVERIAQFVMQGGGLVIAPGDQIAPRAYQQTLATLLPCSMRARVTTPAVGLRASAEPAKAGASVDWLGSGPSGLSQVKTRTRLALECSDDVALRFDDGSPALALGRLGRGQTALFALPLDADWSDLPLRPGYLALLARVMRHVASSVTPPPGRIVAGQSVRIPVPPTAERMEVALPDGTRERFDELADKSEIVLEKTWQPGAYRALAAGAGGPIGDASRGAFVVETPLGESDLTPLPNLPALERVAGSGDGGATVRRSLSPILLVVLALIALAEGFLRLPGARKR